MLKYEDLGIRPGGVRIAVMLTTDRCNKRYYRVKKMLEGEKVGSAVVMTPRTDFVSDNCRYRIRKTDIWLHDGQLVLGGFQCKQCNRRFADFTKTCPRCKGHVVPIRYDIDNLEQILKLGAAELDKAEEVAQKVWCVKAGGIGLIAEATAQGVPKLAKVPERLRDVADNLDCRGFDLTTKQPDPEVEKGEEFIVPFILQDPNAEGAEDSGEKKESGGKVAVLSLAEATKLFTLVR